MKKKNLILNDHKFSMIKNSYKQQPKMSQAKITDRKFTTLYDIKEKSHINDIVDNLSIKDLGRMFQPSFKLYTGHIQTNRRWDGSKGKCDEREYDMSYDGKVTMALFKRMYDLLLAAEDRNIRLMKETTPEKLVAVVGEQTVNKVNKYDKGIDYLVDKIKRLEKKVTTMNCSYNKFKDRVEYKLGMGWDKKPVKEKKKTSPAKKRVVIKKKTTPPQSDTESIINEPEVVVAPVKEVVAEPVKEAVSTSTGSMSEIFENLTRANKQTILDNLDISHISSHIVYTNKAWRSMASEKSIKEEEAKLKVGFNELYKMGYYEDCNFEKAYQKTIQEYITDYEDWAECEEGEPSLQHFLKYIGYFLEINGKTMESEQLERYQGLYGAISYIIDS